jgi:G:T-mismatch repair DNA endonuclease (very short patch repair protein)
MKKLGWELLVVWECELRNETKLTDRLLAFLLM